MPLSEEFKKPLGWQKPSAYPGLINPEFIADLKKKVVNLAGVAPKDATPTNRKLKAAILKYIILTAVNNGGECRLSDPEWILSTFYKGKKIKEVLPVDISHAAKLLFKETATKGLDGDKVFEVKFGGDSFKGGFAWKVVFPHVSVLFKK